MKPKNPLGNGLDVVSEGHTLYNKTCTACHGRDGTQGDRAPALGAARRYFRLSEAAIFDKFVRKSTKIADGQRGLGLGLAICRGIVRAHEGEITVRNRPQGGAEFLITLPYRPESPTITLHEAALGANSE